jgi:hypothetical protein
MYYSMRITMTCREPRNTTEEDFRIFHTEHLTFATLEDLQEELHDRYPKSARHNRRRIYRDTKTGTAEQVGCIYHFRNWDNYIQEDWVEVSEVHEKTLLVA